MTSKPEKADTSLDAVAKDVLIAQIRRYLDGDEDALGDQAFAYHLNDAKCSLVDRLKMVEELLKIGKGKRRLP